MLTGYINDIYKMMKKVSSESIILILSFLLSGCLSFGEDVDLSGKEVNNAILAKVKKHTGVVFPEGTAGKNYIYYGSGIDDALAIKVSIPIDKKEEFLNNTIFTSGENTEPYIHIGSDTNWWKLESLTDPVYTIYNFPNGDMVECSARMESG